MPDPASRPAPPSGFWLLLLGLLGAGGLAWSRYGIMHQSLANYQRLTGTLQAVSREYYQTKGGYWYVGFTLAGSSQRFGLRGGDTQAQLAELTPLLNGPELTVYYETPGALLPAAVNFDVTQLEAPGQVLVALNDTHRQAAGSFVWLLLLLAVAVPIALKLYLDYRAGRRDDDL